jgi:hypothetical protein
VAAHRAASAASVGWGGLWPAVAVLWVGLIVAVVSHFRISPPSGGEYR